MGRVCGSSINAYQVRMPLGFVLLFCVLWFQARWVWRALFSLHGRAQARKPPGVKIGESVDKQNLTAQIRTYAPGIFRDSIQQYVHMIQHNRSVSGF